MAIYLYKAINSSGHPTEGTIASDTPRQAREELRAKGLKVLEIQDHEAATESKPLLKLRGRRRYGARLGTIVCELSTLLSAGIPMLDGLKTVAVQERGGLRTSLLLLHDRVASGVGLAEAMGEQPLIFDSLCVHMAEVGENSGTLELTLEQWANFKERSNELKDRVATALMYPTFVLVIGFCVALFLMTFVMPMLLENLVEAGKPLPWATRVVKWVSDMLLNHGWFLFGISIITFITLASGLNTTQGRKLWHTMLLRIPIFGELTRKQGISRTAMVIATLLRSGIQFVRAVEVAAKTSGNLVLREALEKVGEEVRTGREIGPALEETNMFPAMVVQLFTVGQETGKLEDMLERLSIDYERQVTRATERMTSILEPILILFLATFVGFILFATVLPILEAGDVL